MFSNSKTQFLCVQKRSIFEMEGCIVVKPLWVASIDFGRIFKIWSVDQFIDKIKF